MRPNRVVFCASVARIRLRRHHNYVVDFLQFIFYISRKSTSRRFCLSAEEIKGLLKEATCPRAIRGRRGTGKASKKALKGRQYGHIRYYR